MCPLSALSASASALGSVQANMTVRSIGLASVLAFWQTAVLVLAGKSGKRVQTQDEVFALPLTLKEMRLAVG
jgi:hypothetical protein